MATKLKSRKKAKKSRPRKPIQTYEDPNGSTPVDAERLAEAKKWEEKAEDARLAFEESKAEYGLAKAHVRLNLARRNRLIAKTDDCSAVDESQKLLRNSQLLASKKRELAKSAKEAWQGCEEQLSKALTETHPLFDKKNGAPANGAKES